MKRNYAPFAFHAVIQTERDNIRNQRTLLLLPGRSRRKALFGILSSYR